MPLGSARDFGHVPEDDPMLDPEALAETQRILGEENLGQLPSDEELEEISMLPFEGEDAEVGTYLNSDSDSEMQQLMAYLEAMKPEYTLTPRDLCELVEARILTTQGALDYLRSKGVDV